MAVACHSDSPASLGGPFMQPGRFAPLAVQNSVRRSVVAYFLTKFWTAHGSPSCIPAPIPSGGSPIRTTRKTYDHGVSPSSTRNLAGSLKLTEPMLSALCEGSEVGALRGLPVTLRRCPVLPIPGPRPGAPRWEGPAFLLQEDCRKYRQRQPWVTLSAPGYNGRCGRSWSRK